MLHYACIILKNYLQLVIVGVRYQARYLLPVATLKSLASYGMLISDTAHFQLTN